MKKKYQSLAECWSNLIIEEYVRHGVEYACISPGSRSTLLVKAIAEHPKIKSYVHFDERSNGFFATGLARQTQKPVLVITTSGTAVANLLPSCIEAYEQNIPVIYLTADRPFELLGCGANQSIQQETILKDWVHHYKTIPTATQEISAKWILKQVDETMFHSSKGPIHLNLQYREPFLDAHQDYTLYLNSVKQWQEQSTPYTSLIQSQPKICSTIKDHIRGKRVLIIVGQTVKKFNAELLTTWASDHQVPILAECLSHISWDTPVCRPHPQFLAELFNQDYQPETIILIGGKIISKEILRLLKQTSRVIQCHDYFQSQDSVQSVHIEYRHCIDSFIQYLIDSESPTLETHYKDKLMQLFLSQQKVNDINKNPYQHIIQCMTKKMDHIDSLFISNSMPIRLINQFFQSKNTLLSCFSNRGASGIDGIISSAAGVCCDNQKKTVLITGDLAFLYDTNGLFFIKKYQIPLTIVVLNNNGGGIFHSCPIAKEKDIFQPYFQTPHQLDCKYLAYQYDIDYQLINYDESFLEKFDALNIDYPMIIEIKIDQKDHEINL